MGSPQITAVVATYNEEKHIASCLAGLLNQGSLRDDIEILVIDGASSDQTVEIVKRFPEYGSKIRLLQNPRRLQVYAWNIGTREARGKYVTFISAHTEYSADYLEKCLKAREKSRAANVGGVQVAVGDGTIGSLIAWAMQSPFGIGNGRFRYASKEQYVDHVFTAFLEKETLERLGGFDESFPVNEDCELNYRLRQAGHTIFCSPQIRVRYHARSSLKDLARQMYRYGYWRRRTQLKHPKYVPLRVYAPPMLLLGLALSAALYLRTGSRKSLIVPFLYASFMAMGAANASMKLRSSRAFCVAPAVLFTMHCSYGIGWWLGFFTHRTKGVLSAFERQHGHDRAFEKP